MMNAKVVRQFIIRILSFSEAPGPDGRTCTRTELGLKQLPLLLGYIGMCAECLRNAF